MTTSAVTYMFSPGAVIYASRFNQNFSDCTGWDNGHEAATNGVHGVASGAIMGTAAAQIVTGKKTFSGADTLLFPNATPTIAQSVGLEAGLIESHNGTFLGRYFPDSLRSGFCVYDHFGGTLSQTDHSGPLGLLGTVNGTAALISLVSIDGAHYGTVNLATGTDTNGNAYIASNLTNFLLGSGRFILEALVKIPASLSDGTNTYTLVFGLTNGNYKARMDYAYNDNAGKWTLTTQNNGSVIDTPGTTAVVAGAWQRLKLDINAAATSISCYVDDVLQCTATTQIPTSTMGIFLLIQKSVGTSSRTLGADYISVTYIPTAFL
jgi:hypothetical protein